MSSIVRESGFGAFREEQIIIDQGQRSRSGWPGHGRINFREKWIFLKEQFFQKIGGFLFITVDFLPYNVTEM